MGENNERSRGCVIAVSCHIRVRKIEQGVSREFKW